MNQVYLCPANQWASHWFASNTHLATEQIITEREQEGFEGKSVDREHVRQKVFEYWLEHALPAGVA